MPRVNKTTQAEQDLEDIWVYIAMDNPGAADRLLDALQAQCRLLAAQPHMGRERRELAPGLRSFPFRRYVIFYLPLPDGIDVVRVLHSAVDIEARFGPDGEP